MGAGVGKGSLGDLGSLAEAFVEEMEREVSGAASWPWRERVTPCYTIRTDLGLYLGALARTLTVSRDAGSGQRRRHAVGGFARVGAARTREQNGRRRYILLTVPSVASLLSGPRG